MDNFRPTRGHGFAGFKKFKMSRHDKGHNAEVAAFDDGTAKGGAPPIPFADIANITRAIFAAVESAPARTAVTL